MPGVHSYAIPAPLNACTRRSLFLCGWDNERKVNAAMALTESITKALVDGLAGVHKGPSLALPLPPRRAPR